jgi:poly-gamma-glutamate synthase PgsB/CapB
LALVPALLTAGLTAWGVHEMRRHERYLRRVPIRVHVNGTRGKSSVTRLIASGLRAGGIRTLGKTTGTMARLIRPDGSEVDVYRVGHPNIIEQTRVVRRAVEVEAQALVVECMAVAPELQPFTELRLIRSTVGVITNCRADHLDVMGPTVDDVARALSQTCPRNGHLFTAERERAELLAERARERGSQLHLTEASSVTAQELESFSYLEHADNVALALATCEHLGVKRATALRGMVEGTPDPGALRRYRVVVGERVVDFVNAFAANDPDSTLLIWQRLGLESRESGTQRIVLANCRPDRIQRSEQIADFVARRIDADHVVLSGEGTDLVAYQAVNLGLSPEKISNLGRRSAESVYEHVLDLVREQATVVGIGNIVGLGEEIVLHFSNRAVHRG